MGLARALAAVPARVVLVWVPVVGPVAAQELGQAAQAQPELDRARAEVVRAVALLLAKEEVVRESGYRLPRCYAARP